MQDITLFCRFKRDFTPHGFPWVFVAFKEPFVLNVVAANDDTPPINTNTAPRPKLVK